MAQPPVTPARVRGTPDRLAGGHWTFHGVDGDIRRDAGHLQLWRKGECISDLQLQDLRPGLIEDDRIQFDAFADAIATGKDRQWMQETTLGSWMLMEACNASARTGERIDVDAFCRALLGESVPSVECYWVNW